MPLIDYKSIRFSPSSIRIINICNQIINEYDAQGFSLTLRQLYYQLVSRDVIPNQQKEYKRLGSIVNDARLAGYIDWNAIEDRTRNLVSINHWEKPGEIIADASLGFRMDKWASQYYRPEVWIEKDALVGVIEKVCESNDVPFFSCRGYTSQSEMWGASQRFVHYLSKGQQPYVIHLGDHDPSGKDMSRDIEDRLNMFVKHHTIKSDIDYEEIEFKRIALNMDQVRQYRPPPNPAKFTDSRCHAYVREFGTKSWELDALSPDVIANLITSAIRYLRDDKQWAASHKQELAHRQQLDKVSRHWNDVVKMTKKLK